jgi:prolipoprotein diacylglyceryltransferase
MSPYVAGVPAYLACQAMGILLAIGMTVCLARAAGLPVWRVLGALVVLVSAAMAGAVLSAPAFSPTAGLRYPGAGVGALVALPLARSILAGTPSLLAFGDMTAAPLAFATALGKVGCFLHGCCHGLPSEVPWAVAFPHRSIAWFDHVQAGLIGPTAQESLTVHPLQLYFALWLLCVGLFGLFAMRRMRHEGQLLVVTVSLYAVGLFVADRFKVPPDLQVQASALLMVVLGGAGFLALAARGKAREEVGLVSRRT